MRSREARRGLTLLELLVVIAMIAVMLGLMFPAVQVLRASAHRTSCSNNVRQIGLALHAYHQASGSLPPGVRRPPDPFPYLTWHARLLPFLEQEPLWRQTQRAFATQQTFWIDPPHVALRTILPVYACPAEPRRQGSVPEGVTVAFTGYLGVSGLNRMTRDGLFFLNSQVRLQEITDGTSNTLMVGERPPSADLHFGWWYGGVGQAFDGSADSVLGVRDVNVTFRAPACAQGPYHYGPGRPAEMCDTFHFWSLHSAGAHFLFADGSVRFLTYSADAVLPALATRAGGEAEAFP